MLQHTRQTVYLGVAYSFSPQPVMDPQHALEFQGQLAKQGLVFSRTQSSTGFLALWRDTKALQVLVRQLGPGIGSIAAIAAAPWGSLDEVIEDANLAFTGYRAAWPGQQVQVIGREVTMRQLYQVAEQHAFTFLWEKRLRASPAELTAFRRPVLGGGLRFHMVPESPDSEETEIDVRIESLFSDPSKLFIELLMKWHRAFVVESFDAAPLIREADRFLAEEVVDFIGGAVP
jgi:hypothetical protein